MITLPISQDFTNDNYNSIVNEMKWNNDLILFLLLAIKTIVFETSVDYIP
jgi:hypothetical protein